MLNKARFFMQAVNKNTVNLMKCVDKKIGIWYNL